MTRCITCNTELAKFKAQMDDGVIREIHTHPPAWPAACQYQHDGVNVTVKVVDEILLNKFQEFAQRCLKAEAEVKTEVVMVTEKKEEESLLLPAKKRLSLGELGITDYKTIRELIKDEN